MSYNILGINPFHNGSACVLSDGEIVYFLEEERLTKFKHDPNPFKVIGDVLSRFKIDEVVIAGINHHQRKLSWTEEDPFMCYIRKHIKVIKFHNKSDYHHLTHAYHSFYNSGFNKAIGIVFDSGGSTTINKEGTPFMEQNSIYLYQNSSITPLNLDGIPAKKEYFPKSIGMPHSSTYSYFTRKLGFGFVGGEGKLMGLSSYGKYNPNIPPLFNGFKTNPNLIWLNSIKQPWEEIDKNIFPFKDSYNWNLENLESYEFEKDLAWRVQHDTQNVVKEYILKYTEETGIKNVVCSGGYFLNCVANYYLIKELPHINFYFEPVAHDGGTAIGAAYWRWKELNSNFTSQKQKTLYYGPKYSKEELLNGIKKYL